MEQKLKCEKYLLSKAKHTDIPKHCTYMYENHGCHYFNVYIVIKRLFELL